MRPFSYARPASIAEAVALLATHGPDARVLAGGTDLIIRLRDGSARAAVVVDLKRIPELDPAIREIGGRLVVPATAVMTDIGADERIRQRFTALAEAAMVVGSVQIRNRATLAGNLCNASPAADTAPALLVFGAEIVAVGPDGARRVPIDELFVRSGETTLRPGELVTSIELPLPAGPLGSTHVRRTRRRGHDLASVTLACSVDGAGVTRLAYGSLGPRPVLGVDPSGTLADPTATAAARDVVLEQLLAGASPSPRSMRASPEYRLAMLGVLARRALATAVARLAAGGGGARP
ncbi:MAG TPA: xanthine dehydrogenase family protein subunit M [Candidatus Limnocylindrales bacterium]|nr:xanthine dehydrogenase family protein subunit M [Candidatus Limnocylindrales bacterium]